MSPDQVSMDGTFDYKTDSKYRVSVPVDWRPAVGEKLRLQVKQSYGELVVVVMTSHEFAEQLAGIDADETLTPLKKRQMKGALHARVRPVGISEQGKLLVPQALSEAARLPANGGVKLVGRGTCFEIWNPECHATMQMREAAELAPENERHGIF